MSVCREKSRKASGTMHVLMSAISSRPMGQAHATPCGRYRHRWLQPPLLSAHAFVPEDRRRERWEMRSHLFAIGTRKTPGVITAIQLCSRASGYLHWDSVHPHATPPCFGLRFQVRCGVRAVTSAVWQKCVIITFKHGRVVGLFPINEPARPGSGLELMSSEGFFFSYYFGYGWDKWQLSGGHR